MRTDADILADYLASGSEPAFAELVARHGPMIYRTCLRRLGDLHEAEDAAQTAFMVFVRRARDYRREVELGVWLHGIARRVAAEGLRSRSRRRRREEEATMIGATGGRKEAEGPWAGSAPEGCKALALLDDALAALPVLQRQAVMLRYLEGHSEQEAARLAGCPQGTLSQRASRGLERLRERLSRQGVALSAAGLVGLLGAEAAAPLPSGLSVSIQAVCLGHAAASPAVAALAKGVGKMMFWMKVKVVAAVVCAATAVGGGGVVTVRHLAAAEEPSATADWPRFYGTDGDGKSPITGIRKDWTGGLKKVWEVKDLSPSTCTWSTPSIQGNRLVVMGQKPNPAGQVQAAGHRANTDVVFCFDADKGGKPLWTFEFEDGYGDYGYGTGPVSTPAIDGDRTYVVGRGGQVFCLNMADGKKIWEGGALGAGHGYNASPLVMGDLVILPGLSFKPWQYALLGAAKKTTGKLEWYFGTAQAGTAGYVQASPRRVKLNGREQILYGSCALLSGIDPVSGKSIWEYKTEKAWGDISFVFPVIEWPFFYVTNYPKPPLGLKMDGNNVLTEAWRGFTANKAKIVHSLSQAIPVNGYLYSFTTMDPESNYYFGCGPVGHLVCFDPKTGRVMWEEKTGNGSLILVDGCLLGLTYTGDLFLVLPSPDGFKKIAEWKGAIPVRPWIYLGKPYFAPDPAPCWTMPVAARGKLYLRYDDTLTCYDLLK
jgi:RNA polymerase sigma factor (sigma-70 family)